MQYLQQMQQDFGDMLDEIVKLLPEKHEDEKEDDSIKVALIRKA